MFEDDKDFEDFIGSHMEIIAENLDDKFHSKRMKELTNLRRKVNKKAVEIVESKSPELVSSLLYMRAKENTVLASIIDIGWTVNGFEGVSAFFNKLANSSIHSNDLETAIMYRAFALAIDQVGVQAQSEYDEDVERVLTNVYQLELDFPDENEWDMAHTELVLENAAGEVWWEKVNEIAKKQSKREDDDE